MGSSIRRSTIAQLDTPDFRSASVILLQAAQNLGRSLTTFDHLGNRRVRRGWRLLENQFRIVLVRHGTRHQGKMSVYQEMSTPSRTNLATPSRFMAAIR